MRMMKLLLAALCATTLLSAQAFASTVKPDPQIINWNGIAFAWPVGDRQKYKPGDALLVYDVVGALDEQTLMPADCQQWSVKHKGVTWCFASEKNQATFTKSITPKKATTDKKEVVDSRYEPLYGGRCALGTSWGVRSPLGDPRTFEVTEHFGEPALLLQSHNKWKAVFREDVSGNFSRATLAHRIYTTLGAIVPNAELQKSN